MQQRGELTETLSLRLTKQDRARLEALAAATGRGRGDVVRLLLALAQPSGAPDLILKSKAEVRK